MSESLKETLLKYDVPIQAGVASTKKSRTQNDQTADPVTRDVLNSILPPREFSEDGQDLC